MGREKEKAEPTRRSFLNILWIILGGVALAEFVAVAFAFLRPRKLKARREDVNSVIAAGAVERFEPKFGHRICERKILSGAAGRRRIFSFIAHMYPPGLLGPLD